MLLHVVCCAGSAGCGWWRLWGAALWGASTVKVNVRGVSTVKVTVRGASTVKVTVRGVSTVKVTVRGASTVKVTVRGASTVKVTVHSARTPQGSAPQPLPTTSSITSAAYHMQ